MNTNTLNRLMARTSTPAPAPLTLAPEDMSAVIGQTISVLSSPSPLGPKTVYTAHSGPRGEQKVTPFVPTRFEIETIDSVSNHVDVEASRKAGHVVLSLEPVVTMHGRCFGRACVMTGVGAKKTVRLDDNGNPMVHGPEVQFHSVKIGVNAGNRGIDSIQFIGEDGFPLVVRTRKNADGSETSRTQAEFSNAPGETRVYQNMLKTASLRYLLDQENGVESDPNISGAVLNIPVWHGSKINAAKANEVDETDETDEDPFAQQNEAAPTAAPTAPTSIEELMDEATAETTTETETPAPEAEAPVGKAKAKTAG